MQITLASEVLIIGGGPVGLVASCLLSQYGIRHFLVERRESAQRAPAAHVLRKQPMEILRAIGVADRVERVSPSLPTRYITWCATLAGSEIGRLDLTGPGGEAPWTNCPQNVLEPILRDAASSHQITHVLSGTTCESIEDVGNVVRAVVRESNGSERQIAERWAIAADGASSSVRRALDVEMLGMGPLG